MFCATGRPPAVAEASPAPRFKQLTFKRGFIQNARFREAVRASSMRPDGRRADPAVRNGSPGPRVADAESRACDRQHLLARRGGADSGMPARLGKLHRHARHDAAQRRRTHDVLEDVARRLGRQMGGRSPPFKWQMGTVGCQFPIGQSLYATCGELGWLAFSPRGNRIAFTELPLLSDEAGSLRSSNWKPRDDPCEWRKTIRGLDWSPAATRSGCPPALTAECAASTGYRSKESGGNPSCARGCHAARPFRQ